jgi:hypothetical protein
MEEIENFTELHIAGDYFTGQVENLTDLHHIRCRFERPHTLKLCIVER